jgi:hypothetical protein
VKVLCEAQRTEPREAGSEVLVIAAEQGPATPSPEPIDVLDIARGKRASDVSADEPQLIVGALSKPR